MTTAAGIIGAVRSGKSTAESTAEGTLKGILRVEPTLRAFLSVDEERVLLDAREVDRRLSGGEDLLLAGLPIAVKDNMTVEGYAATCGSKILQGFHPGYDATAVALLKRAGAVIVGKTNLDEFAMGSSTENSAFGATRNPWDPDRVPGGSSGGSAAAVAAREVPAALGSDTGGSVRQPAALCGVVGLKPTYGRISRYGLVAFASSLDQIGPLTRNVEDSALLYSVMAGADALDSTTARRGVGSPVSAVSTGAQRLRIGILREALVDGLDSEVAENFRVSIEIFRRIAAEVVEVTIPRAPYAIPIYYVVANAEASSNLARFDGIRYGPRKAAGALEEFYSAQRGDGFGPEVKRRILLGTFTLSAGYSDAYYGRASRARQLLRREFEAAFERVDVIICPTVPAPAFRLGEKVDDPISMYLSDVFTTPASLAGLPAISVPSGLSRAGLPLGLQVMAGWWQEETLFAAAGAFEKEARIGDIAPPITA